MNILRPIFGRGVAQRRLGAEVPELHQKFPLVIRGTCGAQSSNLILQKNLPLTPPPPPPPPLKETEHKALIMRFLFIVYPLANFENMIMVLFFTARLIWRFNFPLTKNAVPNVYNIHLEELPYFYFRGVITVGTASAVFGGIWRYLAVFGGIWRYLAVFGGIWRYLAVFGGIWRYLAVFGGIWRYLAVFGGIWRYLVFVCFMRHVSQVVVWSSCCLFAEKRTALKKIILLTSQSILSPYFWISPGNLLNLYIKLE